MSSNALSNMRHCMIRVNRECSASNNLRCFSTYGQRNQQPSATRIFADSLQNSHDRHRARMPSTSSSRTTTVSESARQTATSRNGALDLAKSTLRNLAVLRQTRVIPVDELQNAMRCREYESQLRRRWRLGDIYAPHDLSGVEMQKWKKASRGLRPKRVPGGGDVIDQLKINPIAHYKNFAIMGEYTSEMGRIRSGKDTCLRPANQRRMARAIRRAIGTGLMPSVHRHPELIKLQWEKQRLI